MGIPIVAASLPSRSGKTRCARARRRRVSELLPNVAIRRASARSRVASCAAATSVRARGVRTASCSWCSSQSGRSTTVGQAIS